MKLYQIDAANFSDYGEIIGKIERLESINNYCWYTIVPKERQSVELWQFSQEVYIEPTIGVGAIFLQNESEKIKMFLLDRPIMLSDHVWFSIISYRCEFKYILYAPDCKKTKISDNILTIQGIYPKVKVSRVNSVLYQEKSKNFKFKGGKHSYWELTYMDSGSIICNVEGKDYELEKDSMMFFTPYQYHTQRTVNNNPVSFFTTTFDFGFSDSTISAILGDKIIKADSTVQRLIKQILAEYNMGLLYSNEVIVSSLNYLIICAIRIVKGKNTRASMPCLLKVNTTNSVISNCLEIIDENIAFKVSVEFLASKLYVSSSQLRKLFKKEVGVSLSRYIKNRRLEHAKYMLRMGNYSITQVSDMLGYCSVPYFSSEFKKTYNTTPSEYSKSVSPLLDI